MEPLPPIPQHPDTIKGEPQSLKQGESSSGRVYTPQSTQLPVHVVPEVSPEASAIPKGKIKLLENEPTILMRIARVLDNTFLGNVLSFEGLVHKIQPTSYDKFRALYIRLRYGRSSEAGRMTQLLQAAIHTQNIAALKKAIQNAKALEQKCRKDYQDLSGLGGEIMAKLSESQTDEARIAISSIQGTFGEPLYPNYLTQAIEIASQELERLHNFSKGRPQMSLIQSMYLLSSANSKVRVCSDKLMRAFPRRRINSLEFDNALQDYREARAQFLSIKEQIQSRLERRLDPNSYKAKVLQPLVPNVYDNEDLKTLWEEAELELANDIIRETDRFLKDNGVEQFIIQIE